MSEGSSRCGSNARPAVTDDGVELSLVDRRRSLLHRVDVSQTYSALDHARELTLLSVSHLTLLQVLTKENQFLHDRLETACMETRRLQSLKAALCSKAVLLYAESERLQSVKHSLQQEETGPKWPVTADMCR